MLDLSSKTLSAWLESLPDDIREAIESDIPEDSDAIGSFSKEIEEADASDLKEILEDNEELLESLGRAARIRLASHISNRVYPYQVRIFHEIMNEADDEDEAGGKSKIQQLFLEDLKALNEAIAARVYSNSMDAEALEALRAAAYETELLPGLN
jgi:uncharacterized secreted protein with C-terminal beta-propeller domain